VLNELNQPSNSAPTTHRRKLILLAVLMGAPLILSYLFYFWGTPSSSVNYGELIEVRPLPDEDLRNLNGATFRLGQLRGKWVMLQLDSGVCEEPCRKKLYYLRQVRLTQGPEMDRIERVWLIDDGKMPEIGIRQEYTGTWLIDAKHSELLKAFPATGSARDHIYLIDPLGNLMMRFPKDADPSRMVKDLKRLLKISRIG